jgi:hypothetical protein
MTSRSSAVSVVVVLGLLIGTTAAQAQQYAYGVTGFGFFSAEGHFTTTTFARLVTIDVSTGQAVASLTLPCNEARGVAVRADGLRVYVACHGSLQGVLAIDPVAKQIVGSRTLTAAPGGIAITPSGDRLVVPTRATHAEVLDATSLSTIATINTGGDFEERIPVVIAPDASTAYISRTSVDIPRGAASRVIFANLSDFTATDLRLSPPSAGALALSPDGSRLVVGGQVVSILSTATRTVAATYDPTQVQVGMFAIAADTTRAYVANGAVLMVDLASGGLIGELPIAATALEMSAAGDRLFAASASTFSIFNPATSAVVASGTLRTAIDLAAPVTSPAIAPDTCSYALSFRAGSFTSPPPRESPNGSRDWRIDVIALPDRCGWTAHSDVSWITFQRASGTGPDNIGITIAPSTTGQPRTGTITIGGQSLTITQAGCTNPLVFFERPSSSGPVAQPYQMSGWAIDTCSGSGTGISDPTGTLGYGRPRPDVAAAFGGPQFTNSGFEFIDTFERLPGVQDISVVFRDTLINAPVTATVRANILPSIAPFGSLDTPQEGATVSGDMPLTGWIMDDVRLLGNVEVFRDALPGEPNALPISPNLPGRVFLGVAPRVAGARPDVQALFPDYADNHRAGYGAMILTNALPNGGNGTFTFHVRVADRYHVTWLGPRTVTVDNASSPLPFGAVDTPASGQTVSGIITVHGWALTPGTAMIPVDGSTIDVVVDGVVVGHPAYNQARPDVQRLFPAYTNSAAPGGSFVLDTRTLSNGLHTIAWVVRDNAGNAKGIGSKFFTVENP